MVNSSSSVTILGISAYFHDAAAAILVDGEIVAAAQEERFTRKKHDAQLPINAIKFCLDAANIDASDIDYIAFYDKPLPKFERLLETYLYSAPRGLRSFVKSMPVWLKEKLFLKTTIRKTLTSADNGFLKDTPLLFSSHHQAHAASAFYPSPFDEAVVVCLDGVGEWETSSIWHGKNGALAPIKQLNFPHSLGLLYSSFTFYLGFKVNSGEYKMMGLAPYGTPRFSQLIKDNLLDIKEDGSFRLALKYFDFCTGLTMIKPAFGELFGEPTRDAESEITQFHMDVAASIQAITEEIIFKIVNYAATLTDCRSLCLAGGVALNCVANGKIIENSIIENIWIQPASGDDGGALGAALSAHHTIVSTTDSESESENETDTLQKDALTSDVQTQPNKKASHRHDDNMRGAYLGPEFSPIEVKQTLDTLNANYLHHPTQALIAKTAQLLSEGNVVGWFQGRMEFGPRSLGNRSILADPRSVDMQTKLNLKIKQRESFRPFAPAVLRERVSEYFNTTEQSPYMLLVSDVANSQRLQNKTTGHSGLFKLKEHRSTIPAVTHVDFSARVQTVDGNHNRRFHQLLKAFDSITGCPVLVNTSFNVRGEPIICTPEDAVSCFMRTDMDYLVIGDYIMRKTEQTDELRQKFISVAFDLD